MFITIDFVLWFFHHDDDIHIHIYIYDIMIYIILWSIYISTSPISACLFSMTSLRFSPPRQAAWPIPGSRHLRERPRGPSGQSPPDQWRGLSVRSLGKWSLSIAFKQQNKGDIWWSMGWLKWLKYVEMIYGYLWFLYVLVQWRMECSSSKIIMEIHGSMQPAIAGRFQPSCSLSSTMISWPCRGNVQKLTHLSYLNG